MEFNLKTTLLLFVRTVLNLRTMFKLGLLLILSLLSVNVFAALFSCDLEATNVPQNYTLKFAQSGVLITTK